MKSDKVKTETDSAIVLRDIDNYRSHTTGPDTDDVALLGEMYDGASTTVWLGNSRLWTRDPATFRALAIALTMAADELDAVRARYYAEQKCVGTAEYGHGLSRTTVHAGCCDESAGV